MRLSRDVFEDNEEETHVGRFEERLLGFGEVELAAVVDVVEVELARLEPEPPKLTKGLKGE